MSDLSYEEKVSALEEAGRLTTINMKDGTFVIRFAFHNRILHSYSFGGVTESDCIDKIFYRVQNDVWNNCK